MNTSRHSASAAAECFISPLRASHPGHLDSTSAHPALGNAPTSVVAKWTLLLAMASGAPLAHAVNFELTLPDGDAGHISVAPGALGSLTFDLRNLEAQPGTAVGWVDLLTGRDDYVFGIGQPAACGSPFVSYPSIGVARWHFPAALGGSAGLRCTYPIARNAASLADGRLSICIGQNGGPSTACLGTVKTLIAGTMPDIAMQVSPIAELAPGATETVFRVTVTNHSPVATSAFNLATSCMPRTANRPYSLDVDFEGACPRIVYNEGCVYDAGFGVPPPIENWLVEVPPLAAQGQASCLVKMRFATPLVSRVVDSLSLRRPGHDPFPPIPLASAPHATGRDVNAANDGDMLFGAVPFVATPVPTTNRGLLALFALLAALLVQRHYRRGNRRAGVRDR